MMFDRGSKHYRHANNLRKRQKISINIDFLQRHKHSALLSFYPISPEPNFALVKRVSIV